MKRPIIFFILTAIFSFSLSAGDSSSASLNRAYKNCLPLIRRLSSTQSFGITNVYQSVERPRFYLLIGFGGGGGTLGRPAPGRQALLGSFIKGEWVEQEQYTISSSQMKMTSNLEPRGNSDPLQVFPKGNNEKRIIVRNPKNSTQEEFIARGIP